MNIEKIKPTIAIAIVLCASPFFLSVLSFFILSRGVFFSLNMWQMIGIGMGICCPILLINSFVAFLINEHDPIPEIPATESQAGKMAATGLISTSLITLCLLVAYFLSLSLKKFYWTLFLSEIGLLIIALIINGIEGRNRKKNQKFN